MQDLTVHFSVLRQFARAGLSEHKYRFEIVPVLICWANFERLHIKLLRKALEVPLEFQANFASLVDRCAPANVLRVKDTLDVFGLVVV